MKKRWLMGAALALAACSVEPAPTNAASYSATNLAELRALLPRLAPGDVVNLGNAAMGNFVLSDKPASGALVLKLKGVTLKGGVFDTIKLSGANGLTLDGGRVVMPVTDEMKRNVTAMLFYRPKDVTVRNYDISTDRTEGWRPGYAILLDGRGGSNNVTVEDTLIHDIASGVIASIPRNLTLRRVTTRNIWADAFFISLGDGVVLDQLYCDRFKEAGEGGVHSDCIQIDKVAGPTVNLTIKDLKVRQDTDDFAQWIFAPAAQKGGRHSNWKITGTRGVGNTWRALSVSGVDGLVIEDNVMLTPSPPALSVRGKPYATMMSVTNSTDVVLRNNTACVHIRNKNERITEKGTKKARCR